MKRSPSALARLASPLALFLAAAGCGDSYDGGGAAAPPPRASVTIAYAAPTATDPAVAAAFAACVQGVAGTHLHPSWRTFERVDMTADGATRWTLTLADVPVGTRERFRINDPNVCAENATGAVTRDVSANGVPLTDLVDTPGQGLEPGFAFTVAADGTVTP
jgi:hypothetical protein